MVPAAVLILASLLAIAVFGLMLLAIILKRAIRRKRGRFASYCVCVALAALGFWLGYSNLWHTFAGSTVSGAGPSVFLTMRPGSTGFDVAVDGDDGEPRPYFEFKCAILSLETGRPEVYDYMNRLTTGFCFWSGHITFGDGNGDGHLDAGDAFKLYNIPAGMKLSFVVYHIPSQSAAGIVTN